MSWEPESIFLQKEAAPEYMHCGCPCNEEGKDSQWQWDSTNEQYVCAGCGQEQ